MEIKLSAKKITFYIILVIVALTSIHVSLQLVRYFAPDIQLFGLDTRFDVDSEVSIPTWFSQALLLCNCLLLAIIAWQKKEGLKPFYKHWIALSVIFLYLSIDEGSMLHEMLIDPTRALLGPAPGYLYFAWVIPFSVLLVIFFIIYIPFLKHLSNKFRILFFVSGFTYIFGALGLEMIGSKILSLDLPLLYYLSIVCLEETLEMLGLAIFLYSLMAYIQDNFKKPTTIESKKDELP